MSHSATNRVVKMATDYMSVLDITLGPMDQYGWAPITIRATLGDVPEERSFEFLLSEEQMTKLRNDASKCLSEYANRKKGHGG